MLRNIWYVIPWRFSQKQNWARRIYKWGGIVSDFFFWARCFGLWGFFHWRWWYDDDVIVVWVIVMIHSWISKFQWLGHCWRWILWFFSIFSSILFTAFGNEASLKFIFYSFENLDILESVTLCHEIQCWKVYHPNVYRGQHITLWRLVLG